MEAKPVILILLDISGYTHFIRTHKSSQIHAEEIIFDLLETVIDQAKHPMVLNKLEGDAAFLYSHVPPALETEVALDILQQVRTAFQVFRQRTHEIATEREECACGACQRVVELRLKAILHFGHAFFRHIRQFEELAGEDVILIHRLLKNQVPEREYLVMTQPFNAWAAPLPFPPGRAAHEHVEGFGAVDIQVVLL